MKTYVHKRNKKLSTVLNIIVLVSVITTAGIAIGHMWGVRDDCAQQSSSAINKILSNLYKLQEENAYLRNKIKEFTLANSIEMYKRKGDYDKPFLLKQKCKKVFEESLSNKNVKSTKCVDEYSYVSPPPYEQEILNDLDKLRTLYKYNKSWLENEVAKHLKNDEITQTYKHTKLNKSGEQKKPLDEKVKQNLDIKTNDERNLGNYNENELNSVFIKNEKKEPGIDAPNLLEYGVDKVKMPKKHIKNDFKNVYKSNEKKIKVKDSKEAFNQNYEKKSKLKKNKISKKDNKYEKLQWKGEKDNSDTNILNQHDNMEIHQNNYIVNKETSDGSKSNVPISDKEDKKRPYNKQNEIKYENWFERRSMLRMASRKMKEIGENGLNNAGWYFRRMRKREQCRAKKPDNSTSKKNRKETQFRRKYERNYF